jgi:hypothetical protein
MASAVSAKTVAVTMFFDLKHLSDALPNVRSAEFYKNHGRTTLATPSSMVVFCDATTKPWIAEMRAELAPGYETHYVERNITDYDLYSHTHSIIVENRKKSPGYKGHNERNTASYFITCMFKFTAVLLASRIISDASHYLWIDFGCGHVIEQVPAYIGEIVKNPKPRVCVNYIHYRQTGALKDMEAYLMYMAPTSIAGTMWTCEANQVVPLYNRAMSIYYEQLSRGVGHTDESVFTYLYDRYPDMFTLYYGDYRSCAMNYHRIRADHDHIRRHFIGEARMHGRHDLADACEAALNTTTTS